jgi:hypothetical protein
MNYIESPTYRDGTEIIIYKTEVLFQEAQFANDLMKHLAIVAAVPDGEDTVGRQKMRMMTEREVVARATKIAELAFVTHRVNGLILELPAPKPANIAKVQSVGGGISHKEA